MKHSRPNSAQPGRAPARRLTGGPRMSASALPHACPPSLARCPVGPTYWRQFLHSRAPSSLSASRARFTSAEPLPPCVPFSLSAPWACPVSSALPAPAVDRRVRTRARHQISRPRRPPTRPAPFLEPRQRSALAPRLISRSSALSRALPMPPAAAGDPRLRS